LVQVTDLEQAAFGGAVVPGRRALLDVSTGAERLLARAGEDDRPHSLVGPCLAEGFDHFFDRLAAEGVVPVRPVDGDDRGGVGDGVVDVLVVAHAGPPCLGEDGIHLGTAMLNKHSRKMNVRSLELNTRSLARGVSTPRRSVLPEAPPPRASSPGL